MPKFSLADQIGGAGVVLTIVLLVLDKAGKMKGGMLLFCLFVAGLMTLVFAISSSWVTSLTGKAKAKRLSISVILVLVLYAGLGYWISEPLEAGEARQTSPGSEPSKEISSTKPFIKGDPARKRKPAVKAGPEEQKSAPVTTSQKQESSSGGSNVQQSSLAPNSPNMNAPNGMVITGGNVTNPTVNNNYGTSSRPFSISPEQQRDIAGAMLQFRGSKVDVDVAGGDPETNDFGSKFVSAIKSAGIEVSFSTSGMHMTDLGLNPPGITASCGKNREVFLGTLGVLLVQEGIIDKPIRAVRSADPDKLEIDISALK